MKSSGKRLILRFTFCQALISSSSPSKQILPRPHPIPVNIPTKMSQTPPPLIHPSLVFPSPVRPETKIPSFTPATFSEPEVIDIPQTPNKKAKFLSSSPMTPIELQQFLEKGSVSFSSITEDSIPPLVDRNLPQ